MTHPSASGASMPRLWARVGDGRTPADAGADAWTVALRLGANGVVVAPRRSESGDLVVGGSTRFMRRRTLSVPLSELWPGFVAAEDVAIDLTRTDDPNAAEVARCVEQARDRGYRGRVSVMSPEEQLLGELSASSLTVLEGVGTLHLSDPRSTEKGAEAHAAALREVGIDGVVAPEDHASAGLVALMHRFGRIVLAQGTDFRRTARRALAIGVDGIIGADAEALHDAWRDRSEA